MGYLPVVVEAVYMGDYRIKLEFDNGEKRLVDCEPWLKGDIFQPLKDKNYFQKFFVELRVVGLAPPTVLVLGPIVDQEQQARGRQALNETIEHRLRLGVNPV